MKIITIITICIIMIFAGCSRDAVHKEPVSVTQTEIVTLEEEASDVLSEILLEEYTSEKYDYGCQTPEECTCEYCDCEECIYPPPRLPMVALTFDDGPSQYTEYILDILKMYNARATFCVVGNRIEDWPNTIRRAVCLGNEVIGHSWDHTNFSRLNADQIASQILDTSAAIEAITGFPPPPIFRAPYGRLTSTVRSTSQELGYSILNWSIDPKDWRYRDPEHIYNFIMENVRDGSIVVLHDIRPYTSEAMTRVIPGLIENGFQLVTASELLEYFHGELEPGHEYARGPTLVDYQTQNIQ